MGEWLVVFTILATVTIATGNKPLEWVGVFAVLFTFGHAAISNRMAERQARMVTPDVQCYKWSDRYFIFKEGLWFIYFLFSQSYAALVGVIIFLIYHFWRKLYRKWKPWEMEGVLHPCSRK